MNTILLPVDFSDKTSQLLAHARTQAKAFGSTLYIVHAVLPNEDSSYKDKKEMGQEFAEESANLNQLAQQAREVGIETHALLLEGIAPAVIVEESKRLKADLIVMGSHGRGTLASVLMGDVSQEVIRYSPCPVFLVPTRP